MTNINTNTIGISVPVIVMNESLEAKINRLNSETNREEKAKLYNEIKATITESNKVAKDNAISAFLESVNSDICGMFKAFINNPFYEGHTLRPDSKTGEYKLSKSNRQITFPCLEDAFVSVNEENKTLAKSNLYHGMVARFLHNLMSHNASALGNGTAAGYKDNGGKSVSVPAFNGEVSKEYREVNFSLITVCGLKDQINAIVNEILPEGMEIHMVKADVRALLLVCQSENKMEFKTINEVQLLNKIFNCMEIRMNDKAYSMTSKAKCHKAV